MNKDKASRRGRGSRSSSHTRLKSAPPLGADPRHSIGVFVTDDLVLAKAVTDFDCRIRITSPSDALEVLAPPCVLHGVVIDAAVGSTETERILLELDRVWLALCVLVCAKGRAPATTTRARELGADVKCGLRDPLETCEHISQYLEDSGVRHISRCAELQRYGQSVDLSGREIQLGSFASLGVSSGHRRHFLLKGDGAPIAPGTYKNLGKRLRQKTGARSEVEFFLRLRRFLDLE